MRAGLPPSRILRRTMYAFHEGAGQGEGEERAVAAVATVASDVENARDNI